MAKTKNPDTTIPTISAAPSGIAAKAPAVPAQQRSVAPLKGTTDSRLKPDQDQAFQAMMAKISPADEDLAKDFERRRFLEILQNEALARENADDIEFHLLTSEEILTKEHLTSNELRAVDTRSKTVAGMAVIETKDENSQPRFLVGNSASNYLLKNPKDTGRMTNLGEAQRAAFQSDFKQQNLNLDISGSTLMNPRLVQAMKTNPQIASYVSLTLDSAKRNGIDGVMLANQFWQESRFNPNAGSNMGAQGIGQIMPKYFTGKYGLNTAADFKDPVKSIEAGAAIMGEITRRYKGDQVLALAEYNGGKGAVDFAKKLLGKSDITGADFVNAMEDQVRKLGKGDMSLWRNQTNHYVQVIAGVRPPEPA